MTATPLVRKIRQRGFLGDLLESEPLSRHLYLKTGGLADLFAIPESTEDVGLVGCSIGDAGGEAILDWARTARGLRMICIKDNAMSDPLRQCFRDLGSASHGVAVYV